jgi:hypothetical protein
MLLRASVGPVQIEYRVNWEVRMGFLRDMVSPAETMDGMTRRAPTAAMGTWEEGDLRIYK